MMRLRATARESDRGDLIIPLNNIDIIRNKYRKEWNKINRWMLEKYDKAILPSGESL